LDTALEEYRGKGCWLWVTLYLAEQAKALLRAGDLTAAQGVLVRAFREQETTGECWAEAELYRIKGEICALQGNISAAQAAFDKATSAAHDQKAQTLSKRILKSRQALGDTNE
jgi:predicted ATPase